MPAAENAERQVRVRQGDENGAGLRRAVTIQKTPKAGGLCRQKGTSSPRHLGVADKIQGAIDPLRFLCIGYRQSLCVYPDWQGDVPKSAFRSVYAGSIPARAGFGPLYSRNLVTGTSHREVGGGIRVQIPLQRSYV